MKTRRRLSIFLQLTLLAVAITVLAVIISGYLNYYSGGGLLTEVAVSDLQDKANLRRMEVTDSVLETARDVRHLSVTLGKVIREDLGLRDRPPAEVLRKLTDAIKDPMSEDGKVLSAAWDEGVAGLLRKTDPLSQSRASWCSSKAISRIDLVCLAEGDRTPQARVIGRAVMGPDRAGLGPAGGVETHPSLLRLFHRILKEAGSSNEHPLADVLGPSGEAPQAGAPAPEPPRLHLCRRIGVSSSSHRVGLFIVVALDLDVYMRWFTSRFPRHSFYLLDPHGRFLFHPQARLIGSRIGPDHPFYHFDRAGWGAADQKVVGRDLMLTGGVQLPADVRAARMGVALPDSAFFTTHLNGLSESALDPVEAKAHALLKDDPELRCNRVHRFSTALHLSHPDARRLRKARDALSATLTESRHRGAWSAPLRCEHFIAQMVPLPFALGGDLDPMRLVVTTSTEDIQARIWANTHPQFWLTLTVVLVVSAPLGLGLAYYVTRPLRSIVAAAGRLGQGDYSVELPPGGPDEVAQLSSSFHAMVKQVRARDSALRESLSEVRVLNQQLDAKVRERTAQLEVALEQARAAARAKDTFVANMSHELRQPLHIIIGFTEALREEAERFNQAGLIPDLDKILTAARHLLALINDILDQAKIAAGKMELQLSEFPVTALVKDLQTLVDPLVVKNNNRFSVHLAEDAGVMTADEKRVTQVLLNLLSNACKFTRGGQITLQVSREEVTGQPWLRFGVRDTGKGMTADQLKQLFGRFYQADDSTRREHSGTGLGLAITRSLCDLMGGTIDVTSAPDKGSEFVVRLPAAPAPPAKEGDSVWRRARPGSVAKPAGERRPAGQRPRVLVIDDDQAVCDLMERFLTKQGFDVRTAPNGEDGLKLARALHPHIITLDVMIPGVDGWAILAALKTDAVTRDIPVVMVTIVDDQARGFSLGATDYITKPIDWNRLGQLLQHHLDRDGSAGPVLVIDDEPAGREMVQRVLAGRGREVVTAANGREGLELFKARRPGLILLDLMMPVMDGFEFLAELRKLDPQRAVPVIVITAKDLTTEDAQKLNGGIAQVIQKGGPGQLESILEQIRARL